MRTIGEITGELHNLIDRENESHGLWDAAFTEARRTDGRSPFTPEQVYQKTLQATQIHGEAMERIRGIIRELTHGEYVDRNSPPEVLRAAEQRLAAARVREQKQRARADAELARARETFGVNNA